MKKLHILIVVLSIAFFGIQNSNAQSVNQSNTVYKTTKTKTPEKVKVSLKEYSGYKISNEVTFTKNSKGNNIYKFKVRKGNWSHFLLINESGKIIGIETGEH
ncbi:MAG: hypothetical protein KAT78_06575 [Flavobacteriaceae bacterium]|nr:hypothetical protein [Flavobacteriaceae bacterium]